MDMPEPQHKQVQLKFPYVEGNVPTYANAVLVNLVPDGMIIDFGFFDPLLLKEKEDLKDNDPQSSVEQTEELKVYPLERIVLSRQAAEQLSNQLKTLIRLLEEEHE